MVAPGALAPGHLGELTRIVPFELVDCLVDDARARERRFRLLPSRTGVYFLLAMCLFPRAGYLAVWGKLTAALDGLGPGAPSAKALRDLRRRIGIAPARALFEVLAGPLGHPRTPAIMAGGYRTVSFNGCKSVKVPDTPANRGWLGKMNAALGVTGYPVIQFMALAETGTRALLGAAFGSTATSELDWARQLLLLDKTMLVRMDRGFRRRRLPRRGRRHRRPVPGPAERQPPPARARHLPDGSFTSVIGGVKVRVIAAEVTVTRHDGTSSGGWYRLATTLLDHRAFPAARLMALCHERWEHEVAFLALRHTLLQGRVLRSGDPAGLQQEAWALLALYQALRTAITDAVQAEAPGTDPDRASYQAAVDIAQDLLTTARTTTDPDGDLAGSIGRAVLTRLNPPRRPRVCARRVKSPLSR